MPGLFSARSLPTGIYTVYCPKAKEDELSLAKITPNNISITTSGPWGGNNFTTRFHRRDAKDELAVNFFGEILSPANGTGMGALGGTGRSDKVVLFLCFIMPSN